MLYFYFHPSRYYAALATLAAYWSGDTPTTTVTPEIVP